MANANCTKGNPSTYFLETFNSGSNWNKCRLPILPIGVGDWHYDPAVYMIDFQHGWLLAREASDNWY
jgi:hypothetical protein